MNVVLFSLKYSFCQDVCSIYMDTECLRLMTHEIMKICAF